jgi:hypothetical protein
MYYVRLENDRVVEKTNQDMHDTADWMLVEDETVLLNRVIFYDPQLQQLRGATEEELALEALELQAKAKATEIRLQRNLLLESSDKLALVDRWDSFTPGQQANIKQYRQRLRDVTTQPNFPEQVEWPTLNLDDNT